MELFHGFMNVFPYIFWGGYAVLALWAHFSLPYEVREANRKIYASHKRIMKEAKRLRKLGYL